MEHSGDGGARSDTTNIKGAPVYEVIELEETVPEMKVSNSMDPKLMKKSTSHPTTKVTQSSVLKSAASIVVATPAKPSPTKRIKTEPKPTTTRVTSTKKVFKTEDEDKQNVGQGLKEDDELDWKSFELNLKFDQLNSGGTLDIKRNFIAWANAELKGLVCKDDPVKVTALFSLPNIVLNWQPDNVSTFVTAVGFPRTAQLFLEHEVDGTALMLLRMEDIWGRFKLVPQSAFELWIILYRLHQTMNDVVLTG